MTVLFDQLIPNVVYYENWTTVSGDHFEVPADIRAALQKKGHVLQSLSGGTICQFIVQDVGTLKENGGVGKIVAVSDPRKGGFPAGY
jgi:gamma-glutamyltranspeptidase/glutathione hydrolase/leukotriene-C4 hydrolase